jgi:hypothetical protein
MLLHEKDASRVGQLALIGALYSLVGFAAFWTGLHFARIALGRKFLWLSRLYCLMCFYFFSAGSVLLVVLLQMGLNVGVPQNEESLFFATSPGGLAAAAANAVLAKVNGMADG